MFAKFGQSLCADRLHVFDLLLAQLQIAKHVVFLTDRIANGMTIAADHAAQFITCVANWTVVGACWLAGTLPHTLLVTTVINVEHIATMINRDRLDSRQPAGFYFFLGSSSSVGSKFNSNGS